jgi:hypothetical protein
MKQQQRNGSLQGLAAVIAKRITSIRQLHVEKGELPPLGEIANQFRILQRGNTARRPNINARDGDTRDRAGAKGDRRISGAV